MKIVSIKAMIEEAVSKSRTLRLSMIKGAWGRIAGSLAVKSEPLGIKDGVLYIAVENSVFLHAMEMKKDGYIMKINAILKGQYVVDIKYRVRKIDLKSKIERGEGDFCKDEEKSFNPAESKTKNMSLEESIKYLSVLAKKREAFLLEKGYRKCRECGSIFLGRGDRCPKCRGEKETVVINKY